MSDIESGVKSLEEKMEATDKLRERVRELEEKVEGKDMVVEDSMEQFVRKVKPENHQQCAIAIAYYLDVKNGVEFTMEDINEGFKECRWNKYSNMRMLKSCLKKEWIRKAEENSEGDTLWIVTNDGLEFVEEKIQDEN